MKSYVLRSRFNLKKCTSRGGPLLAPGFAGYRRVVGKKVSETLAKNVVDQSSTIRSPSKPSVRNPDNADSRTGLAGNTGGSIFL
jgi:hypothetical protein